MNCPICESRAVRGRNKTCGDIRCVRTSTAETRSDNELADQLDYMKRSYGKDNPWTKWLQERISSR